MQGKIIKLVAGVYTVLGEDTKKYECKPRGVFRYQSLSPKVGDNVEFNDQIINKIEERKNDFTRPFIANVDYVLLFISMKKPDFSFELLDRFLINIIEKNTEPYIIVTKCDLASESEMIDIREKMSYYEKYYKVFYSRKDGMEKEESFKELIKGKIGVVSGQTGSGKSHFLNYLSPSLLLKTQEISSALGRGKHTTRHTEILNVSTYLIADTPGFSSLEFLSINPSDLKEYFPEFVEVLNQCRFNQCLHLKEPGCQVKKLVSEGKILASRYENYKKIYGELVALKPVYRKEK
ncbi:MAG: ribosome small subunit-dependent GTPase A [Bacillales bacterium]|nr:ribosome small subunit-dependent GTPase A [Bacillales bacterium]